MTLKSRILRILLIAVLVLGFGGYFAFSTFVFSPTESAYGADLSTLVPRNVDFFVAKARLSGDFSEFPRLDVEPEVVALPAWQAFVGSEDFEELDAEHDLTGLRRELEALPAQLRGIDPLKIFGGKDVAVAGWFRGPELESSDWAVYGRVNWMGKLAESLLSYPGLTGMQGRGMSVAVEADHVAVSGGDLAREVFVTRVRDVVVAGTSLELVQAVKELEARAGQDSFGQSAQYFDHVQNAERSSRRNEFELYVDWRAWSEKAQRSGRWPDPASPSLGTALIARYFQLGSIKALSGIVGFESGLRAHLHADLSSELVSPVQAHMYRQRGADRREIQSDAAAMAPRDSGLFAYLRVPMGDFLRELLDAVATTDPAVRSNLDDLLRSTGGYASSDDLIAEFDGIFRDRVALIVRRNDYPIDPEADAPNDGQPVHAVSVVLWTDGSAQAREKIDALHDQIVANQQNLGLSGKDPGSPGVFRNEVSSGHYIWEFWSQLVPGTGHLAAVIDGDRYIVSNSFRMLGDVLRTFRVPDSESLADHPEFKRLAKEGLPQANALVWLDPRQLAVTSKVMAQQRARDELLGSLDLARERVREEATVLRQEFGGRSADQLSEDEGALLGELVDARMDAMVGKVMDEQVPVLARTFLRRIGYTEAVSCVLLMLALDPKEMELSVRALVPLE